LASNVSIGVLMRVAVCSGTSFSLPGAPSATPSPSSTPSPSAGAHHNTTGTNANVFGCIPKGFCDACGVTNYNVFACKSALAQYSYARCGSGGTVSWKKPDSSRAGRIGISRDAVCLPTFTPAARSLDAVSPASRKLSVQDSSPAGSPFSFFSGNWYYPQVVGSGQLMLGLSNLLQMAPLAFVVEVVRTIQRPSTAIPIVAINSTLPYS
jgi:hypothetical protein